MSTIPETSAARGLGMEVFAMSLITNLAAGITDEKLTHNAVTNVAQDSAPLFTQFMKSFLGQLTPLPVCTFASLSHFFTYSVVTSL
jgi:purine-nucleoside phosphorylase